MLSNKTRKRLDTIVNGAIGYPLRNPNETTFYLLTNTQKVFDNILRLSTVFHSADITEYLTERIHSRLGKLITQDIETDQIVPMLNNCKYDSPFLGKHFDRVHGMAVLLNTRKPTRNGTEYINFDLGSGPDFSVDPYAMLNGMRGNPKHNKVIMASTPSGLNHSFMQQFQNTFGSTVQGDSLSKDATLLNGENAQSNQ